MVGCCKLLFRMQGQDDAARVLSAVHAARTVLSACLNHSMPIQLTGGVAAFMYGAKRPLYDVDFTVFDADLERCSLLCLPYSSCAVTAFEDEFWRFRQFSCVVNGWNVDVAGHSAQLFSAQHRRWVDWTSDLSRPCLKSCWGELLPLEPLDQLIEWKSQLRRPADLLDLGQLSRCRGQASKRF